MKSPLYERPADEKSVDAPAIRGACGSRRKFLSSAGALVVAITAGTWIPKTVEAASDREMFAYVGCYTTKERNGNGEGINVYRMDPESGGWTHLQLLTGVVNPSFLALDHRNRHLYSVHGDMTYATAYAIDPQTGRLTILNQQATGGKNAVHLALDPTNRFLVVSNYSSGSVAVLPINPDGSLAPLSDLVELQGKPGPNRTQQASSHPHENPFDRSGRFLVVPDKGLDRLFVFRLDAERGKLVPADTPSIATREGAGPRHVDFHPSLPYAYVINELDSTFATYRYDSERGVLEPQQVIPSLPSSFTGNSTGAEIAVAPSGRFVYASNRGHNSIAVCAIDPGNGLLSPVAWESTGGETPRFFTFAPSGNLLYAGNQDSDTVVTFRVDPASGKLSPTGQVVKTGSPVTIVFR